MSEKDWDAKFEVLLAEDLIDLPPHLREEKLYFSDPNQMDEIFQELEERNLYLIHRKQEIEHTLEQQEFLHRQLVGKLGKNRDVHLGNKHEFQEKIQQSMANVHDLKKASHMNMIASNQAAQAKITPKNDKKKEEGDINLEELLNDLSSEILRIYKNTLNPHADLNRCIRCKNIRIQRKHNH